MNTETCGCKDCDETLDKFPYILCPKHELEQLKWRAETAQSEYEDEILKQREKRKEAK